jgi:hypothetical protein
VTFGRAEKLSLIAVLSVEVGWDFECGIADVDEFPILGLG